MEKEIVKILIANRSIKLGNLLNSELGLNLKTKHKRFPSLIKDLDEILYIINKLENLGYVKQKHIANSSNEGSTFFEGIDVEIKDEKTEITANKLHWFVKHIIEIYCWEITTESGLIEYIKNGYLSHDERNWRRTRNLSIGVALIASILTSILTAVLTSPPILNCF